MNDILAPKSAINVHQFTHLAARITEEDDAFVVQVRLHNNARGPDYEAAWGEEVAESMEDASEMIRFLAARFSIPEERISLEIRMESTSENTHH